MLNNLGPCPAQHDGISQWRGLLLMGGKGLRGWEGEGRYCPL